MAPWARPAHIFAIAGEAGSLAWISASWQARPEAMAGSFFAMSLLSALFWPGGALLVEALHGRARRRS